MLQTADLFPGFPRGPDAPDVVAAMPAPSIQAWDALLAEICDAEATFLFDGIEERITPIPGTEVLADETDADLDYENLFLPSLAYAL